MRRRGVGAIASSPTMVGAITVLIVAVAVFLAYNANKGLPFVPSYRVSALVPDAASLVPGNDVRIGGVRVGLVESIEPEQEPNGATAAKLDLKLDKSAGPLPRDSSVIVRSRSALGLKYLEVDKGRSAQTYPEGSILPLSAAHPQPVEIDQVLNTFNGPTRTAIRRNLTELGNALAGRGVDLNQAIGELRPLVTRLRPVMRNVGAPSTGLDRFFRALEATASEVAPVAETQAHLVVSLDATFGALATVARPFIQETISKAPPTEATAISTLPRIRPFLAHTRALFADLAPGARALKTTAPVLARALEVGAPVLRDAPKLNAQLPPTAQSLLAFNNDTGVRNGIDRLTKTGDFLSPTLEFVAPAQSVCNYATILLGNAASLSSTGDGLGGTWQHFIGFNPPAGPNNEGSPSSKPANGGGPGNKNFLHFNPYPNTASPGQPRECEAGNEPYATGRQVIGNVPGSQGTQTKGQK